jgi:hypothetical protein
MEVKHVHERAALCGFRGGDLLKQVLVVVHLARFVPARVQRRLMGIAIGRILKRNKVLPTVADAAEHQRIWIDVLDGPSIGNRLVAQLRERRRVGMKRAVRAALRARLDRSRHARLPPRRQGLAPQARLIVEAVEHRRLWIAILLDPVHELVGEHIAVGGIGRERE